MRVGQTAWNSPRFVGSNSFPHVMERLAILASHLTSSDPQASASTQATSGLGVQRNPTSSASSPPLQVDEGRKPVLPGGRQEYDRLYRWSLQDPPAFWAHMAKDLYWKQKWHDKHVDYNFDMNKGKIFATWFDGAKTNMSYNCLDRWVNMGRGKMACLLWEGNGTPVFRARSMSYKEVLDETCRLANWLKAHGVRKGDTVAIYLPMIPELPIAMLACARIGAVHSVVFGGFSAESLAQRMQDCKAAVVITATGVYRGSKVVQLKSIVDAALKLAEQGGHRVKQVLVVEKSAVPRSKCPPQEKRRDLWWSDVVPHHSPTCEPEWVDAEHPLFLLYTSGSTGNPKGVLHTTAGYMVSAAVSAKYIFDLQPGDVYWCTADCGWITGHTYLTYGPLLNGATNVLFGSTPAHPTPARCWEVIDRYKVRVFYTAPTLLRALMQHGDKWLQGHDRSSLRVLGTVGEPINEHAWKWFSEVVGEGRCPIVDTWWQTETGSVMITPLPGAWPTPPGCATLPLFGVEPVLLTEKGEEMSGAGEGILAIRRPWPSMFRDLHGDHQRYEDTYFAPFKGYYFTGDGCRRDENGYYTITGRVDDVINVSGHRVGTAEVENALTQHQLCAEAAVISVPHDVKGESIYAFVTLTDGGQHSEGTKKALKDLVRKNIGAFAVPDTIHWAPSLPKTRSGKIMRRILRKLAAKKDDELGDVSTLADPSVIDVLKEHRGK